MLIMVLFLVGVIALMMDCAKKTMRGHHQDATGEPASP